jgi:hypothetical protein
MSHYDNLDGLIVQAIERGANPLYDRWVNTEARLIGDELGREAFRIVDGRLTALKKAGRIIWRSKKKAKAAGLPEGWSAC